MSNYESIGGFLSSPVFDYSTASTVPYFDANKYLISSAVTAAELGYVSGVTSGIQGQLNAKVSAPVWSAGRVVFHGVAAFDDDALFFWDDSNKRLGVGAGAPAYRVHVTGTGATSATYSMRVENSSNVAVLMVRDDGIILNGTETVTTREYVQSRELNLITNGSGLLENNFNFASLTFDATETHGGSGSFATTATGALFNEEYINVDTSRSYQLTAWAKVGNTGGSEYFANVTSLGHVCYDSDLNSIGAQHFVKYVGSTDTTLAAPLNPGDLTIVLTDATGWHAGGSVQYSRILMYPYTNGLGYTYSNYTYSRLSYGGNLWSSVLVNTLTLAAPWAGPAYAAGTPVRNTQSGDVYSNSLLASGVVPNAWARYQAVLAPPLNSIDATTNFRPGTQYVRALMYPISATGAARWRFSDLHLTEYVGSISDALPSAQIIVGSAGNVATAVAMTGDVTISNTGVTTTASGVVLRDAAYPRGFVDLSQSTITWDNGTKTLSIAVKGPAVNYAVIESNGTTINRYTISATQTATIAAPAPGFWWFYFSAGVLTYGLSLPNGFKSTIVAGVYLDASNNAIAVLDERHGISMPWRTHQYLHMTIGVRYETGFGLSRVALGTGGADGDAQVVVTGGTIWDEDIECPVTRSAAPTARFEQELGEVGIAIGQIPIYYRLGTTYWAKFAATNAPLYQLGVGQRPTYNSVSLGTWGLTQATNNNDYVVMYVCASNSLGNVGAGYLVEPVVAIMGQASYASLALAEAATFSSLSLGTLFGNELKTLWKLVFRCNTGYANAYKAYLVEFTDLRSQSAVVGGSALAADHNSLSGRTAAGAHPATAITVDTTAFNKWLTAADDTLQLALDRIDDLAVEPTLTKGNLTEATSTVLTIVGGTGAVIGTGASIQVKDAGAAQTGVVTTGAQTLAGAKTLSTAPILSSLTASQILALDASKNVQTLTVATYPSLVELAYVKNVTSAIQTQLNAKEPTLTKGNLTESTSTVLTITGGTGSVIGAGTSIQVKDAGAAQTGVVTTGAQTLAGAKTLSTAPILSSLTASQILALDASNNVQTLTVATYPSLVELAYVKNVTSAIQTQLNAKEPTLTKGNLTEATSTVLTIVGGTGAVIGTGASIQVKDAGAAQTGVVTTGAQTLAGAKTLSTAPILSSLTASQILALDASNNVQSLTVATYPSLVELAYVKGVTSAIQTQINGKITSPTWNAGRVMFHGASGVLDDAEFFWNNTSKSLGVGVATFGTNGVNVLALGTGVAPTTSPADSVQLWEADRDAVAGKGSLHVRTEDGTSHVIGDLTGIGTMTPGAALDVVQAITASATAPNAFQVVGAAHTALTLSTEAIDVDINLARTVQFATGALTQQRAMCLLPPTYGFVGASTITDAVGLCVGAPAAGTNATITNTHGIRVGAGAVGSGTTNSYGLTINAQTGGTNNYAAQFLGGNVGIKTSAPLYDLTFSGETAATIGMTRKVAGSGVNLTIRAGGAQSGVAANSAGDLLLYPGVSVGTGQSDVRIYAYPGAWSGTADNAPVETLSVIGDTHGCTYTVLNKIRSNTFPITNWNVFTPDSFLWDIADTNVLWGRANQYVFYRDGVPLSVADKRVVTEGNFEGYTNVNWRGLDGAADVVYRFNFTALYGASGIGYNLGAKFFLNFYSFQEGTFPSAWSARVLNNVGVYTPMTLVRDGNALVGAIPINLYLTEIEVTLSTGTGAPYVTGTTKWALVQAQLHMGRMACSQGGSVSSRGGYFGNDVTAYEGFMLSSTRRLTWQAGGLVVSSTTAPAAGGQLHVVGHGATSATNTALFENSSGTDILTVRDDNSVLVGGATTNYSRLTVQSEDSPAVFTPSTMPAYTVGLGRVLSNTSWAGNGFVFSGVTLGNNAFSLLWNGTKAFFGILSDASSSISRLAIDATGVGISAANITTSARLHVAQTPAASATSVPGLLIVGAAHTAHTLSTESQDIYFDLSRTVQFATGALTTQRAFYVDSPTYGFVGASTLTDAMTVAISGAPVKGTNATITNTHALHIAAGAVSTATNSYGLTINAQTGGTNNYAAQFLGGNVGIGISAPTARLNVMAGSATANTAPIKITTGPLLTNTEAGAIEYLTDTMFITPSASTTVGRVAISGTVFAQTASATIHTSVVETTLAAAGKGSLTLPAGFAGVAGKTIRIRAHGTVSDTGTPTLQFRVFIGAVAVLTTAANALGSGIANRGWHIECDITFRTLGATGTVMGQGFARVGLTATTAEIWDMENTAAATIDTTITQAIDVKALWGTSSASNTITCTNLTVEAVS